MNKEDIKFFRDCLLIDSTSGKERRLGEWLFNHLGTAHNAIEKFEVGDGTLNIRCSWGTPRVYLCTHYDTVPPYIEPTFLDDRITGRGTCDAKGQIMSMWMACQELQSTGVTDFGLLLLAGEETGSFGAKAYDCAFPGAEAVIVGEPTGNRMVKASKGTRSFTVTIHGKPCHSGYPHLGESAVLKFVDFVDRLRKAEFPVDPVLGETTWNIGKLVSDNPQNILSAGVTFRIYFRTTFASEATIPALMESLLPAASDITDNGGDSPLNYFTIPGFDTTVVAFGSDAPQLKKFPKKILCGPGSIEVAHTEREYICYSDIDKASEQYVQFVKYLLNNP